MKMMRAFLVLSCIGGLSASTYGAPSARSDPKLKDFVVNVESSAPKKDQTKLRVQSSKPYPSTGKTQKNYVLRKAFDSDVLVDPVDDVLAVIKEDEAEIIQEEEEWEILQPSAKSLRTMNPIRAIVDPIVANIKSGKERGDGKDHISLGLGDPTAAGNLPPCPVALEAIQRAVDSNSHAAGYVNACGTVEARRAIARFHSSVIDGVEVEPDNVVVASGCSGALELVLATLLDSNNDDRHPSILLVPQPGFPLYQVIAESHGATVLHYRLNPDKNWEIDMDHVRELVQQHGGGSRRIRGIVINNPSNPTGAVYSANHLTDLVHMADECRLPIVADEVYGDLTFGTHHFHPLAVIAKRAGNRVPVISCSGLGKQFLVPGWRVGWVAFHDNQFGSLREIEAGAKRLAQVTMGASHLIQTAVPDLLDQVGEDSTDRNMGNAVRVWKQELKHNLEEQASFLCHELSTHAPGLDVMEAQGALYSMIRFNPDDYDESIQSDVDFCRLLLAEENVFVLPGSCFGVSNVFRVVFCAPRPILKEAASRMAAFCERHFYQK